MRRGAREHLRGWLPGCRSGVDADLMGAAGFRTEFNQRQPLSLVQLAPVGDRGLALFRRDHPPALFGAADLGERQLYDAFVACDFARDNAEIDFLDLPRL